MSCGLKAGFEMPDCCGALVDDKDLLNGMLDFMIAVGTPMGVLYLARALGLPLCQIRYMIATLLSSGCIRAIGDGMFTARITRH